jgi:DNA polymerase-3 subunit beta
MDLTIDQPDLARALRLAGRVLPHRAGAPVLQAALLAATPGRLTLTAADGDLAAVTTVPADVVAPGRAAVPTRRFAEYVSELAPTPLRLTLGDDGGRLRVTGDRDVAELTTVVADDFPLPPDPAELPVTVLDAGRLRDAIARVAFAAACDHDRPVLATVLVAMDADGLTLAAADGFRLARARVPGTPLPGHRGRLLVPARAVAELGRLLAGADGARLALAPDGQAIHLIAGAARLFTRLTPGAYPDLDHVVPRAWRTRVTMGAAELRDALRRLRVFAGSDGCPVSVAVAPAGLRLATGATEGDGATSELAATVEGEAGAVRLNARLLTDVLDAVHGPVVAISWTGPDQPVTIRDGARPADDLFLVMPLHDPALTAGPAVAA